jgi:hypothetical protein
MVLEMLECVVGWRLVHRLVCGQCLKHDRQDKRSLSITGFSRRREEQTN